MMDYNVRSFFQEIKNQQYDILLADLQNNGHRIASLQNHLLAMDNKKIENLVEQQNFYKGKWTRFNIMLTSFLIFCRDVDPWSKWDSCDVIFQFYTNLNNCLLNDTYPVDDLVNIYQFNTEYIIPLAHELDSQYTILDTKKHQFLSHVSSIISRLFNSIKSQSNEDTMINQWQNLPEKQKILLYLVNKLINIYFTIESPQLCSNIFRNFKPKCTIANFNLFPMGQQIEYRYLLGKYYFMNARITNAFVQLNTSFTMTLKVSQLMNQNGNPVFTRNLRRILRYLIPMGLIIGKLPNMNLVQQIDPSLGPKYIPLIKIVRDGNILGLNQWLEQHEAELKSRHLLLVLLEKLSIVTYRYLIRTVIQEYSIKQNSNRLPYDVLQRCIDLSVGHANTPDENTEITIYNGIHNGVDAENLLITLINLGYLRGNCFPLLKLSVFQRTTNVDDILPPMEGKLLTMFPLNDEDSWLDKQDFSQF